MSNPLHTDNTGNTGNTGNTTPEPAAGSTESTTGGMLKGIGLALTGFAIFSSHDALIKSITDIPTFQIVFFVVLFSFVPFALVVAVDPRERSFRPRLPGLVALRCVFSLTALIGGFYAFGNLPLAQAYSLLFSAPIIITVLAIPLLGERVRVVRWVAILLGLAGVAVVLRPGETELTLGHLAALAAAFSVACVGIITRMIGSREHTITLMLYPLLTNLVVSGICLVFVYEPMAGTTLAKLALIGVLSVVAQSIMISSYRVTEAQFVAPMQYSQMLWALVFGAFLFGETVDKVTILGAVIIILSGLLFIWRELSVSLFSPVLQSRSIRFAGWPQGLSMEIDMSDRVRDIESNLDERMDRIARSAAGIDAQSSGSSDDANVQPPGSSSGLPPDRR